MNFKDCVTVVSGGASGLGEATVRAIAAQGGKAAIFDFDEKRGEKVSLEFGDSVIFCKTDVTDEYSVKAAIDKTIDSFDLIHVVVNCAGVGTPAKVLGKEGPMSMEHFNKVIQINLMGTMNVIRLTVQKMLENKPNEDGERGVIINTASAAAFEGQIGQAAYSASKAGVAGMTLPIAREFADYGIRVATIAPGLFETPMLAGLPEKAKEALGKMIPFPKRLGKPVEFAMLVLHIIENPMINGEVIRLDGAIRMAAK
jgi:3-hydroxyacyl-CoA dehydrogenase / 3-hydroxy-2-methylbutyryl-CoA dehydrogenase